MNRLALLLLAASALPVGSAWAANADVRSPLEGRWSLDIAGLPMPEAERPKEVVMDFKAVDANRWHSHVTITFRDGKVMTADATPTLDGAPSPISGNYYANVTTLRLPAPNTLVMQLVDHGTPTSTRIYTVAGDKATMTETKAFFSHDGTPLLQTFTYRRIP
jgi:hypothetical protein